MRHVRKRSGRLTYQCTWCKEDIQAGTTFIEERGDSMVINAVYHIACFEESL